MQLQLSTIRAALFVIGTMALLVSSSSLAAAAMPDVETTVTPPIVHHITFDGPDHLLTTGPGVDGFHDLLVTSDGDIVVASFHDGRAMNGDHDAWPLRVWILGEPGFTEILAPTAASALAEGPDGALYLAGEGRFLARLNENGWEVLAEQRDVQPYRDHVVADDGTVFAAFGKVLYTFDGTSWARSDLDDRGKRVTNLERSADGTVWLHIADRLFRHDRGRWVEMQPTGGEETIRVLAIDADPDGRLWAMLDNGVGACQPVTIPIDLLRWAPVRSGSIAPRLAPGTGDEGQKQRRCTFGGELLAGSGGSAWSISGRSLRDLTDSTGSLSVGGPHIAMAEADGDGRIWVLAPDGRPSTSDLFIIETGLGD